MNDLLLFDIVPLRTILIIIHLTGLMLGMGCAMFLDIYMLRRLYTHRLEQNDVRLLQFGSSVVMLGLVLLWISGLGFLLDYAAAATEKLSNPKIWSKMSIVVVLTINGMMLHGIVFPRFAARIGRRAFDEAQTSRDSMLFLVSGLVSSVSWVAAFVLGAVKELNNVVSWDVILLAYVALLAAAGAVLMIAHMVLVSVLGLEAPRAGASPSRRAGSGGKADASAAIGWSA